MERNRDTNSQNLGRIIKQQRLISGLTLRALAESSGVSSSHIGRIERGERFPSAHVLRRIARHLGFGESELFSLAGYFSPQPPSAAEGQAAGAPVGTLHLHESFQPRFYGAPFGVTSDTLYILLPQLKGDAYMVNVDR